MFGVSGGPEGFKNCSLRRYGSPLATFSRPYSPGRRDSRPSDLRDLPQRHRVHAIAQATGGRAIREHVAQVGVTRVANGLDALQKRRPVESVGDDILFDRLGERRPARMRLEFLRPIEKDSFTAKAGIDSRLKEAAHFRAEGSFRACLPGYVVFFVAQLRTPFSIRFDDLAIRRGVAGLRQIENIGPLEDHAVF